MKEIWKDIEGYEGFYQVSNLGNAKSIERKIWNGRGYFIKKEYMLKKHFQRSGYYYIRVSKNNKSETLILHRLVAKAFIVNTENKPNVNHIDGNKLNNKIINLEFVTPKENGEHAANMFLKSTCENHPSAKLKNDDVLYIYKSFHEGKKTIKQLCEKFNVTYSTIYNITVKKYWKMILMEV